jgi:hypothetical protein
MARGRVYLDHFLLYNMGLLKYDSQFDRHSSVMSKIAAAFDP